jgi:hypothetical protein
MYKKIFAQWMWVELLRGENKQETPGGRLASLDHLRYALRAGVYAKKGAENGQRIDGFYLGFYKCRESNGVSLRSLSLTR